MCFTTIADPCYTTTCPPHSSCQYNESSGTTGCFCDANDSPAVGDSCKGGYLFLHFSQNLFYHDRVPPHYNWNNGGKLMLGWITGDLQVYHDVSVCLGLNFYARPLHDWLSRTAEGAYHKDISNLNDGTDRACNSDGQTDRKSFHFNNFRSQSSLVWRYLSRIRKSDRRLTRRYHQLHSPVRCGHSNLWLKYLFALSSDFHT